MILCFRLNRTDIFPKGHIYNNTKLVQVMSWQLSCDRPSLEPMMIQIIEAYMRHQTSFFSVRLIYGRICDIAVYNLAL